MGETVLDLGGGGGRIALLADVLMSGLLSLRFIVSCGRTLIEFPLGSSSSNGDWITEEESV